MTRQIDLTRRAFIKKIADGGAGLTLAFVLPACGAKAPYNTAREEPAVFEANAFVKVREDNSVAVVIQHLEMGQGVYTGLATLIAEELDADWDQVVIERAKTHEQRYQYFATSGSATMAMMYQPVREAGAAARQMLVAAAATLWDVSPATVNVEKGVVKHAPSRRAASFGELAGLAAKAPVPVAVTLKDTDAFTHIGKLLPRKDKGKTDGSAIYTQDVQLPGMLVATVVHPPRFGARLLDVDSQKAKTMPGVVAVIRLDNAVAVLATTFWQAKKGRDNLTVSWDENTGFTQSSEALFKQYYEWIEQPGVSARLDGDPETVFNQAEKVVEVDYAFPYLAHAAMEPLSCVVKLGSNCAELWYAGQAAQTFDLPVIAKLLGIKTEQITINTLMAGGAFGRRIPNDYVVEAVKIAKAYGQPVPIKMVWTREDDMRAGYYRPMFVHKLKAALDQQGKLLAWCHRLVGQSTSVSIFQHSHMMTSFLERGFNPDLDIDVLVGAVDLPYQIPHLAVELHTVQLPVPVSYWRSIGHTHNAFSTETFIDRLAAKAKVDPVAYRMQLLGTDKDKHKHVLQLAADKSDWGKPLPKGSARGVALHQVFTTVVAQVAEVSVTANGKYCVEKVTCVIDCGIAVNPDVITAQVEGSIGFGLSMVYDSEITFQDGRVKQSNFHDYQVVRINKMPTISVHIVASKEAPSGVGEPATPVIAPAVANALFAATGEPVNQLPISLKGQSS